MENTLEGSFYHILLTCVLLAHLSGCHLTKYTKKISIIERQKISI